MLLIAAIAVLTLVVGVGTWLGGLYLFWDKPPARLNLVGVLHGAGGALGLGILVWALVSAPPAAHAIRMGAGGFGAFSAILIGLALIAGLTILAAHLRRTSISTGLVATHGMLAIIGYTLLLTYLTMLR